MGALTDQLVDLQMEDAVPLEHLIVDEDGVDGPNAPSPSESDATKAKAAAAASSSKGSSRSELKLQKHQVTNAPILTKAEDAFQSRCCHFSTA